MKKAVQFGAGNIGRGFIGAVLEQAGYHVVFADVNAAVIDKINEDHAYTVHVMDVERCEQRITNISGVNSTTDAVVDAVRDAEIITTAVGVVILPRIAPAIAKGIAARRAAGVEQPLNIIACENIQPEPKTNVAWGNIEFVCQTDYVYPVGTVILTPSEPIPVYE